ncbi:MAG: YIP1 family protein, partial [Thermoproteota archaeon]
MSNKQEGLKEKKEPSLPPRFFRQMLLIIINPKEAFLQVKDSPLMLSILIIPPILVILTFAQYYVFYRIKMEIPAIFYTGQIDSFINSLVQLRLMQYIIVILLGILLALLIFISGKWLGGYGDFKQAISVASYIHIPNIPGLIILALLILFTPSVQTNVLTFVGYPMRGQPKDNIVIGLREYIGEESNLTMMVRAYYGIPLNATVGYGGVISGVTKIVEGEINITYAVTTTAGINKTVKHISLNGTSLDYNLPLTIKNVFDSADYCMEDCTRRFTVDLTLFLNNTYVSQVQENMSIPYIVTLNVYDSNMEMKTHRIASNFYIEVAQCPNPQPLAD